MTKRRGGHFFFFFFNQIQSQAEWETTVKIIRGAGGGGGIDQLKGFLPHMCGGARGSSVGVLLRQDEVEFP